MNAAWRINQQNVMGKTIKKEDKLQSAKHILPVKLMIYWILDKTLMGENRMNTTE